MISLLIWDLIMQHRLVVSYRRFGTTYWSLDDGTNTLSILEERRSQLHHGISLKSLNFYMNLHRPETDYTE